MLKRTFIHLPGVGEQTEAHFWRQGLHTWEDFLAAREVPGLGRERLTFLRSRLRESLDQEDNPAYFGSLLPPAERWRLFRRFRQRAAYLDIETTGYTWPALQVTVVGLYDGQEMRQFVHGQNLGDFPRALKDLDLIVTFNGSQFDLPVLRAYFQEIKLPPVHLDLRFILARLGFKGGLKKIEPRFGIRRPPEVDGLDGYEAVLLWDRHCRGDYQALPQLLSYNREDVVNLETLMDEACRLAESRLLAGWG
jgi:uncharacterized protein YprB with RNaseH-like and TPR domain